MNAKLYVGNLSSSVTEEDIREKFNEIGAVEDVNLIRDRETGKSKGFAFVEMMDESEADMVIDDLDGMEWNGRPLNINMARVPPSRGGHRRHW